MSAGLARVRVGFEKNKKPLAVLGAAAVAGLAVVARRRSAMGSTGSTASTSTSSATPGATTRYGATTQQAAYDSTGSDVYNALQPQIEQLQQLARQIPVAGVTPAAEPAATPAAPAAQSLGYVSVQPAAGAGPNGSIQQIFDNGTSRWISYAEQQLKGISAPTVLSQAEFAPYSKPYTA